ncbi:MAG TPA: nuclear transport factor 2 family protein [Daejeonella sp.]|nr:nuclear transport factor 2 family protein [Daejeonella sp.]
MKFLLILLITCLGMGQVNASPVIETDEESLVKLIDSLSAALVKQDKAWLSNNLTDECGLTDPVGQTLKKDDIIKAFSAEGIYSLTKMEPSDIKYTVNGNEASAAGHIKIEGAMSTPDVVDVSGTYGLQAEFKKTDLGWKISSIRVSQ